MYLACKSTLRKPGSGRRSRPIANLNGRKRPCHLEECLAAAQSFTAAPDHPRRRCPQTYPHASPTLPTTIRSC